MRVILVGLLTILPSTLPSHAGEPSDETRASFKAALAAARTGGNVGPAQNESALRDYPLYPYLEAARLEQRLRSRDPAAERAAVAFVSAHSDEPVGIQLRGAWLDLLATRRDWQQYAAHYVPGTGEAAATCHWLHAEIRRGTAEALTAAAIEQWLTPRSAPDACDPVFDWLRKRGVLDAELIEQRARLALAEGQSRLARWLARSLPDTRAAPILWWASALEQPARMIDAVIASPEESVDSAALLAGWTRLARRTPDAAISRYDALARARSFDADAASRLAQPLALALSWSRRPEALDYFARIDAAHYDELSHEWHVRAALWAEDWTGAARAVATMPDALRAQTRWRYWAARAAERAGARDRATETYASVVPTDNYYALQSAARLEQRFTPQLETLPLSESRIDELATRPAFVRARELLAIEEPNLATREWRHGYAALEDDDRLQAVGLAARWGWHFQSIATAAGLARFNDYPLLYPRPFDGEVATAARLTNLPEPLIYGVIRQESLYQPYAASSAGALGLMQLLPSTAARTARNLRQPVPRRNDLAQPRVNVQLGAATLRELVDEFDGQTALALAGYNAGPGAARRWLPDRPLDADIWIENIPYNETRGYVQRVLWHSVVFAWLEEGAPQDVSPLLARIETAGGRVAATDEVSSR